MSLQTTLVGQEQRGQIQVPDRDIEIGNNSERLHPWDPFYVDVDFVETVD